MASKSSKFFNKLRRGTSSAGSDKREGDASGRSSNPLPESGSSFSKARQPDELIEAIAGGIDLEAEVEDNFEEVEIISRAIAVASFDPAALDLGHMDGIVFLSFEVGATIDVVVQDDSGWWEGVLQGTSRLGVFPGSCVKELQDPSSSPVPSSVLLPSPRGERPTSPIPSHSPPRSPSPSPSPSPSKECRCRSRSRYVYLGDNSGCQL